MKKASRFVAGQGRRFQSDGCDAIRFCHWNVEREFRGAQARNRTNVLIEPRKLHVFGGQVAKEMNPGGPIKHLATLPSQLDGNLVLRGANLYTSTFNVSPLTFSTPDPV